MLTVNQLIELLEQYPGNTEVRIAHQPQWPFQYQIKGVVSDKEFRPTNVSLNIAVIWLVEGANLGPLPPGIWQAEFRKRHG